MLEASTGAVGVAITTFDRVDDARCCLEILRSTWQPEPFPDLTVVHAYSGAAQWYTPNLEDHFVAIEPGRSHYEGAATLLDAAFNVLIAQSVRYAVAMTGDVWAYQPKWIAHIISEMSSTGLRLATARWRIDPAAHGIRRAGGQGLLPTDGLATDFLIIDLPWAFEHQMLPLDYPEFVDRHTELLNYLQELPFLERYLAGKFLGAVRTELRHTPAKDAWGSAGPRRANQLLRLMHERVIDPQGVAAPTHEGHWPAIGLITAHDTRLKKTVATAHPELAGPTLKRLVHRKDLSWYNRPVTERLKVGR